MGCLNLLGEPEVFIPAATLLALVLLVWAQLYASGGSETKNVHWVMGLFWTYLAMFFALAAVAALFFRDNWAKGFLILSFFMTVVNILVALLKSGSLIFIPSGKSLVGRSAENKYWVLAWLALLFGLGFISFSVADKFGGLSSCWFRLGVVLAGATILFVVWMILKNFCCCIRLRWEFRSHWCKNKKKKNWCKWEWWRRWWKRLLIPAFIVIIGMIGLVFIFLYIFGILKCCFWIIGVVLLLAAVCYFEKMIKSDLKNDC